MNKDVPSHAVKFLFSQQGELGNIIMIRYVTNYMHSVNYSIYSIIQIMQAGTGKYSNNDTKKIKTISGILKHSTIEGAYQPDMK